MKMKRNKIEWLQDRKRYLTKRLDKHYVEREELIADLLSVNAELLKLTQE